MYRNYKHFQWQHFETDLKSSLNNCNRNFDEKAFTTALNLHAPKKVKVLRGNHKVHLNKKLRKAIIERSRLENKLNKSIYNVSHKKQGNLSIHQIDNQNLIVSIPFLVERIQKLSGDTGNHTYLISMRWEILR